MAAVQYCVRCYTITRRLPFLLYGVVTLIGKGGCFFMSNHPASGRAYKLVLVALMTAMTLIINRVVPATPVYHLAVDFVPVYIVAVLFGPLWSALTYAVADTIGGILFPVGPFNPGITFTLFLICLVFGLLFYRKNNAVQSAGANPGVIPARILWLKSFIAALATFAIKLFGTTYFLYLTYGGPEGMGYFAYVISRIPNCVAFGALVFVLIPAVQKVIVERIRI